MRWQICKVVFRIKTPVHIGYRKYGNLMQTRPYVPARVLLGALTARTTREIFGRTKDWRRYRLVGEILNRIFTASYFYPTTREDGGVNEFPWEERFPHYDFIGSYVSTALESGEKAAQEGSLHEVEYISPKTKYGGEQVYLSGYFFVREEQDADEIFRGISENLETERRKANLSDEEVKELSDLLQNLKDTGKISEITQTVIQRWRDFTKPLQIGGERGYGWGTVERIHIGKTNNRVFCRYAVDLAGDRPVIEIPEGESIPAHLIAEEDNTLISGEIEPLVRKEWREGPGSKVVFDGVAYKPGTKIRKDPNPLRVGNLGYLTE